MVQLKEYRLQQFWWGADKKFQLYGNDAAPRPSGHMLPAGLRPLGRMWPFSLIPRLGVQYCPITAAASCHTSPDAPTSISASPLPSPSPPSFVLLIRSALHPIFMHQRCIEQSDGRPTDRTNTQARARTLSHKCARPFFRPTATATTETPLFLPSPFAAAAARMRGL